MRRLSSENIMRTEDTISLDGFKTLISDGKFLVYYKNNIIVSAMAAVIICFISVFAGYALSRFHFKWNKMLLATFAFAQMMPVISRLISLYTILRKLNLTDTQIGLVLAISATQVPFTVSLMASFFPPRRRCNCNCASRRGTRCRCIAVQPAQKLRLWSTVP